MKSTHIVILAAGKGVRMQSELPKVLIQLQNQPMLGHVLHMVHNTTFSSPTIVVGYEADRVQEYAETQGDYQYVLQEEQKGTGHAVWVAEPYLPDDTENIIVLYGDQPLVQAESIQAMAQKLYEGAELVIATSLIENDELFRDQFAHSFGRIIRDSEGTIQRIVEVKDATVEELAIREVNVGFMGFNRDWGMQHLSNLSPENAKQEYYLTDLVQQAFEEGIHIESVNIKAQEAFGANTREQLQFMEGLFNR